ncbi:SRPBCC family protein [Candidatus Uhrbacteria bacterium]|nr:SRPBCC family protein [Candidatus Uhrbacteria bacterium]
MSTHTIAVSQTIKQPRAKVWGLLSDFPNIYKYNPNVKKSYSINSKTSGVGAERKCELYDPGMWLVERVVEEREGEMVKIEIVKSTFPINNPMATIYLEDAGEGTKVKMEMEFDNKIPLIGGLVAKFMLKPMMEKRLGALILALGTYLVTGEEVTNKTELAQE